MNRDPIGYDCTANPIYLVQRRVWDVFNTPNWLRNDGDEWKIDLKKYADEEGDDAPLCELVSDVQLDDSKVMEYLDRCGGYVAEKWVTERVLLTRAEATDWVKVQEYNFPDGWRVYCVPCEGELARILDELPDPEAKTKGGEA